MLTFPVVIRLRSKVTLGEEMPTLQFTVAAQSMLAGELRPMLIPLVNPFENAQLELAKKIGAAIPNAALP